MDKSIKLSKDTSPQDYCKKIFLNTYKLLT